ncbi:PspC domain-containing protein [Amycolatopsis sp. CA-230715]|uniref:PspC domain-containing protein n=1 Tax=Amycolatopsis sp. CA-230715 TaxID=2745196 RepID=UPI001C01AAA9|nr:PspC domain-containing protein [Amycolatopsis sp. CA-230715]
MSGAGETRSKHGPGGFEDVVKDFWASRPRRPQEGRKIAGVAAGIGKRYGLDPVVVRVGLVTATVFGGAGLLFYVLGWLLFADERDQVSGFESMIGRGQSAMSKGFTVVACVALIPIVSWVFSGSWFSAGWLGGGGFIGTALLLAALFLLHRDRGHLNRPLATTAPATGFGGHEFEAAFSMTGTGANATGEPESPATPPKWDPLGAAPFAWDLPDPNPAPEPVPPAPPAPRRRRSKVGIATFGIALLTAGAGVAANLADVDDWFTIQHIVGMTLGVLGIGLVVGAFAGGGRGLIGLAIPLSIAGVVLTSVPGGIHGGFGDLNLTPRSAAELQPVYQHSAGDIDLDLTKLPLGPPIATEIRNGAGSVKVTVPDTADVTFTCQNSAGNIDCLDHEQSGVGTGPVTGVDLGDDRAAGGQQINLKIHNSAGKVEVRRG